MSLCLCVRTCILCMMYVCACCAGEGTEQLDPSQAAKIFEGQLASALVAEDGQLALSNLAQSAAHAVMPKLQTQGQLGQARHALCFTSHPFTLHACCLFHACVLICETRTL